MAEQKEFGFEEGVERVRELVQQLLVDKDYVVVAISGPLANDYDVGKTRFLSELAIAVERQRIPHVAVGEARQIGHQTVKTKLDFGQNYFDSKKGVIILGAEGSIGDSMPEDRLRTFINAKDRLVQDSAAKIGLELSGIDIRVCSYRDERPIAQGDRDLADVVIKNEKATTKKRPV